MGSQIRFGWACGHNTTKSELCMPMLLRRNWPHWASCRCLCCVPIDIPDTSKVAFRPGQIIMEEEPALVGNTAEVVKLTPGLHNGRNIGRRGSSAFNEGLQVTAGSLQSRLLIAVSFVRMQQSKQLAPEQREQLSQLSKARMRLDADVEKTDGRGSNGRGPTSCEVVPLPEVSSGRFR